MTPLSDRIPLGPEDEGYRDELLELEGEVARLREALQSIAIAGRIALENTTDSGPLAAHLRAVIASAVVAADEAVKS